MKTYTQAELNKILEQHKLWLTGKGGSRADLRNANLEDADLEDADLEDANLRNANLRNANLRNANLRNANLRNADLEDADLEDADLRNADLRNANLEDASIWGCAGEMNHIKSIFIDEYQVTYTSEALQIGCQRHKIEEWWRFDDERIVKMDGKRALRFWRKYKDFIKMAIELSPANPTKERE